VEYIGQVRAWLYYVHCVNTALFGEEAFKNVIVTGTLAGNDGRKMSKSLGNYTDPNELMDKFSADSLRFLLLSSPVLAGEDFALLDTDPINARSNAYDMVINGQEAGGGSIRIHNPELQKKIFNIIGLTPEQIKSKFGFFVDAFKYGAPPHGGLAFGLDRMVMLVSQNDNIKDVIAFPKVQNASCLMSDAPSEVDPQQLKDLKIECSQEKND